MMKADLALDGDFYPGAVTDSGKIFVLEPLIDITPPQLTGVKALEILGLKIEQEEMRRRHIEELGEAMNIAEEAIGTVETQTAFMARLEIEMRDRMAMAVEMKEYAKLQKTMIDDLTLQIQDMTVATGESIEDVQDISTVVEDIEEDIEKIAEKKDAMSMQTMIGASFAGVILIIGLVIVAMVVSS